MLVLDENSGLIQVTSRRKKGSFNDIARFRACTTLLVQLFQSRNLIITAGFFSWWLRQSVINSDKNDWTVYQGINGSESLRNKDRTPTPTDLMIDDSHFIIKIARCLSIENVIKSFVPWRIAMTRLS